MDRYSFDLENLKVAASELGYKIEVNSDNPGIHLVSENGAIISILKPDQFTDITEKVFGFKLK